MKLTNLNIDPTLHSSQHVDAGYRKGTATAILKGRTLECQIQVWEDKQNTVIIKGMVGRYRTSNKAWPAYVEYDLVEDQLAYVHFGRDDLSPIFQKSRMISFA
jgi:hypothetical protein